MQESTARKIDQSQHAYQPRGDIINIEYTRTKPVEYQISKERLKKQNVGEENKQLVGDSFK